jgi:hypothetical protein
MGFFGGWGKNNVFFWSIDLLWSGRSFREEG